MSPLEPPSTPPSPPPGPGTPSHSRLRSAQPSLLDDLMRDALDPGYAAVAARHRLASTDPGAGHGSSRRRALVVWLSLAALGVAVAAAVHRQSAQVPQEARARAALADDVRERTRADRDLAGRIDALRAETARLRDGRLASSTQGNQVARRLAALEPAVGLTAVSGAGVRVRLSDAGLAPSDPAAGTGTTSGQSGSADLAAPEAGRIQDRDVADVVNALWAAGATAVSVGGVRLTATTAIRTGGQTIVAGFTPLTSPYDVVATGDPQRLATGLADSAAGKRLRGYHADFGIGFGIVRERAVRIPAATVTVPRLARETHQ